MFNFSEDDHETGLLSVWQKGQFYRQASLLILNRDFIQKSWHKGLEAKLTLFIEICNPGGGTVSGTRRGLIIWKFTTIVSMRRLYLAVFTTEQRQAHVSPLCLACQCLWKTGFRDFLFYWNTWLIKSFLTVAALEEVTEDLVPKILGSLMTIHKSRTEVQSI